MQPALPASETDLDPGAAEPWDWLDARRARHPFLAGIVVVALAIGAWPLLLSKLEGSPQRTVPITGLAAREPPSSTAEPPAVGALTDSAHRAGPAPAESEVAVLRRSETEPPVSPSEPAAPRNARVATESASDSGLSPFRRSHPWAAVPGQPYYYPSRCPATLQFADLVFFRTEAQARAGGFVPAPNSGCD